MLGGMSGIFRLESVHWRANLAWTGLWMGDGQRQSPMPTGPKYTSPLQGFLFFLDDGGQAAPMGQLQIAD